MQNIILHSQEKFNTNINFIIFPYIVWGNIVIVLKNSDPCRLLRLKVSPLEKNCY